MLWIVQLKPFIERLEERAVLASPSGSIGRDLKGDGVHDAGGTRGSGAVVHLDHNRNKNRGQVRQTAPANDSSPHRTTSVNGKIYQATRIGQAAITTPGTARIGLEFDRQCSNITRLQKAPSNHEVLGETLDYLKSLLLQQPKRGPV